MVMVFCLLFLAAGTKLSWAAQTGPTSTQATTKQLDRARDEVEEVQQRIASETDPASLAAMRGRMLAVQANVGAIADRLEAPLANLDAQLAQLGPAPAEQAGDSNGIDDERDALKAEQAVVGAQLKLAKLVGVESLQVMQQIDLIRRTRFTEVLGERTGSVFSQAFWNDLAKARIADAPRLRALIDEAMAAVMAPPFWRWCVLAVVVGLLGIGVPLAHRMAMRFAATRLPIGRIRRSLLAFVRTLVPTAATLLAMCVLWWVFDGGRRTEQIDALLATSTNGAVFAAFIGALGRALAAPGNPSWRLPPIPDAMAMALRHHPLYLGCVVMGAMLLDRISNLINGSPSVTASINALSALALGTLLAIIARRCATAKAQAQVQAQPQAKRSGDTPTDGSERQARTVALFGMVVGCVLFASIGCLLTGYIALGRLLVGQVIWLSLLGLTAYLLICVVEDACEAWLGGQATSAKASPGELPPSVRRQIGTLLAGAWRLLVLVLVLTLMFAPLGQDTHQLMLRAKGLADGIVIGEIRILPGAILQALGILVAGVFVVRALRHWLAERYFPTTSLDSGMRSSTATLLGYVGFVIAVALALSALGIGIERVAWVASALSVGIGFGLQAIVQNFVSGLILLTERPVKVGDWVALGDVEGDVRRINVRATEIQMGDRSTVVVPNSEFITKIVRNVTMGSPMGVVQVKLPLPIDADVEHARELVLEAFAANEGVAESPAPAVVLDAITNDRLLLVGSGSVSSPRQAGNVRSALLFDVLGRLRAAGISLAPGAATASRGAPASAVAAQA